MSINDFRSSFISPLNNVAEQLMLNQVKVKQSNNTAQSQNFNTQDSVPLSTEMAQEMSLARKDYVDDIDGLLKKQLAEQFVMSPLNITTVSVPKFNVKAEDLAISFMTKNYQQGLSDGKNSDELTQLIEQSAKSYRKAYSNTSSILNKLGQLGPEQQSFISRSEYRVERALNKIGEYSMRQHNAESDKKSFELALQTQEGDIITIRFSSAQALEKNGMSYLSDSSEHNTLDSFQLSYEVDGDLSEKEYAAMQTIFANVGELADDYFGSVSKYSHSIPQFSSATLNTDLLVGFDSEQLASIDLSMALWEGIDEFDYSYEFNKKTQEQSLLVERNRFAFEPTKFDITTSTFGGQDPEQLAQYLQVMDSHYDEVKAGLSSLTDQYLSSSIDIYKTALTTMFELSDRHSQIQQQAESHFANGRQLVADLTNNIIKGDERYQKMSGIKDNVFKEGMSTLADFNGHFNFGSEGISGYLDVNQKQDTTMSYDGGYIGMKQKKSFDSQMFSFYGDKGTQDINKSEQYEIKAVTNKGGVTALDQKANTERTDKVQTQIGYGIYVTKVIDSQNEASSSMRLIEDIWTQSIEHKNKTNTDYKVAVGTEVTIHSVKIDTDISQQKVLVGDLDKIANSAFLRKKYAPKLASVNGFMAKV
ncbi:hypothetical protein ACWXWU_19680 [Shewanella sp. A14]